MGGCLSTVKLTSTELLLTMLRRFIQLFILTSVSCYVRYVILHSLQHFNIRTYSFKSKSVMDSDLQRYLLVVICVSVLNNRPFFSVYCLLNIGPKYSADEQFISCKDYDVADPDI